MKIDYRYYIAIPWSSTNGINAEWVRIKKDCFNHKEYPTCLCGRKYVPIKKGDKSCFFCNFEDRKPVKIITEKKDTSAKCIICKGDVIFMHQSRRKNPICHKCKEERRKEYLKRRKYDTIELK